MCASRGSLPQRARSDRLSRMICVIDYGMGNLRSVSKALEKLGGKVSVSSDPKDLAMADKIVLPGVGAFGNGMRELKKRNLIDPILVASRQGKPFLGICLGMQLLFEESEESPGVRGLSLFAGRVQRFKTAGIKVPHMGWNAMEIQEPIVPLLKRLLQPSFFYFVHSYYPVPEDPTLVAGTTEYEGERFAAFVGKSSLWASQFHPEKSQEAGLQILRNFLSL